jgi:hypothetical protein
VALLYSHLKGKEFMKRSSVRSTLIAIVAWCVTTLPSHADDKGGVPKPQKSMADEYRQEQPIENSNFSSATISSFSLSQVDSSGRVTSQSKVSGSATGNASVFGRANGNASSTVTRNGRDEKSNASSSARLRIDSDSDNYRSPSNQAASTVSVTKNGIQISRSADADEMGTVTKLDVITRSEKISVRQRSDGPIEVRIQSRKRDAGEKVYAATNRDELKKKDPRLVRRIEAFERIVGTATATVDEKGGAAEGETKGRMLAAPHGNSVIDAKRMMRAQIERVLEENIASPELQELLRKQLQNL